MAGGVYEATVKAADMIPLRKKVARASVREILKEVSLRRRVRQALPMDARGRHGAREMRFTRYARLSFDLELANRAVTTQVPL